MKKKGESGNGLILQKIARLRRGGRPRLLDLFAGCGGLSLGFQAAGFELAAAVEFDEIAARSHATNFFRDASPEHRAAHAKARDITATEPEDLFDELGFHEPAESLVDVIIGGPPCQAFARVGRAKLREVADHPEAFLKDARGNLYIRYIHYVSKLRPLALVMENVPDVLNYGGHNIAEETCEVLGDLGYDCGYTLLNSVFYGVPQMRERMFLMAFAKELRTTVEFPRPTHWIELPRGYHGTRQVALQTLKNDLFENDGHFIPTPEADPLRCAPAVTAQQALSDLPPITLHLEGKLRRGARRFDQITEYRKGHAPTAYARLMREWPGFPSKGGVFDHVIRYLPRDYAIFRRMNPGDQYPEAHQHAMDMLRERLRAVERAEGRRIKEGSKEYKKLLDEIVPPYDPGKFPNKWRKMEADLPARTLMAHLGKDSYSHIHYDSAQARTISVREAARLQSFPDGFVFEGSMNPALRQIGNAVPPLMARALGEVIFGRLAGVREHEKKDRTETTVLV